MINMNLIYTDQCERQIRPCVFKNSTIKRNNKADIVRPI